MEWIRGALAVVLAAAASAWTMVLVRDYLRVRRETEQLRRMLSAPRTPDVTATRTWQVLPQPTGEVVVVLSMALADGEWASTGNIRITLAPGAFAQKVLKRMSEVQADLVEQTLRNGMRVRGVADAIPGAQRKEEAAK